MVHVNIALTGLQISPEPCEEIVKFFPESYSVALCVDLHSKTCNEPLDTFHDGGVWLLRWLGELMKAHGDLDESRFYTLFDLW